MGMIFTDNNGNVLLKMNDEGIVIGQVISEVDNEGSVEVALNRTIFDKPTEKEKVLFLESMRRKEKVKESKVNEYKSYFNKRMLEI